MDDIDRDNLLVLPIFAGSVVAVIARYFLAWRAKRTAYRRAGSLMTAVVAGFAGLLPEHWPMPIAGLRCGYAGGLSPANVQSQLERISQVTDGPTWIDAETHLYHPISGVFDVNRVTDFLESAEPYVVQTL